MSRTIAVVSEPLGPQQSGDEVDEKAERDCQPQQAVDHRDTYRSRMPRTARPSPRKPATPRSKYRTSSTNPISV
jgi:hypothetical protein